MHERHKLAEAHYFLERMRAEHDHPMHFRYETSAFLGAARSVLQYALEEAQSKRGGQAWYHQWVTREPLLAFFKNHRDANIHTTPVTPARSITTREANLLRLPDDDMVIPFKHLTTECVTRFTDWPGPETVIELSQRYVDTLQAVVDDGVAKAMITG